MGRCVVCGKGGLFFKTNRSGLCPACEADKKKKDETESWIPPIIQDGKKCYYRWKRYSGVGIEVDYLATWSKKHRKGEPVEITVKNDRVFVKSKSDMLGFISRPGICGMIFEYIESGTPFRAILDYSERACPSITIWLYSDRLGSLLSFPPMSLATSIGEYTVFEELKLKSQDPVYINQDRSVIANGVKIGSVSNEQYNQIFRLMDDNVVIITYFGTRKQKKNIEHPDVTIKVFYFSKKIPDYEGTMNNPKNS